MRIISAVFALVGAMPVTSAAVASSADGTTRLYALLIFVLIYAAVALFASLSPSRRRACEIRQQVLQQQQNQSMNQQVPHPQAPDQQGPSQPAPQQAQSQQIQGTVSYPMRYQPKQAQPGHSAQQPVAVPSPLEPMQVGGASGSSAQSHSAESQVQQSTPLSTLAQPEERPQQEVPQQAPESKPSDRFSLSTNHKLIPPLEDAQRSRYPMVLSVSTSEDEVFALPSISGVPEHLLVGAQENHVPLNQRPRWQQVDILENYLMRAVMNLQTLERAQFSPLHSFKETAQADRTGLAAELEETIRMSQLKLSGALEFYTSLPRLADAPSSFAFARDHALSLSAAVISLTEQCFERTFSWRLLEDNTLPDSLNDRLYAVRYLRESAQKLAASVELSDFDRAMQLARDLEEDCSQGLESR